VLPQLRLRHRREARRERRRRRAGRARLRPVRRGRDVLLWAQGAGSTGRRRRCGRVGASGQGSARGSARRQRRRQPRREARARARPRDHRAPAAARPPRARGRSPVAAPRPRAAHNTGTPAAPAPRSRPPALRRRPAASAALTPGAVALLARCCCTTLCADAWACCASELAAAPMFPRNPLMFGALAPRLERGHGRVPNGTPAPRQPRRPGARRMVSREAALSDASSPAESGAVGCRGDRARPRVALWRVSRGCGAGRWDEAIGAREGGREEAPAARRPGAMRAAGPAGTAGAGRRRARSRPRRPAAGAAARTARARPRLHGAPTWRGAAARRRPRQSVGRRDGLSRLTKPRRPRRRPLCAPRLRAARGGAAGGAVGRSPPRACVTGHRGLRFDRRGPAACRPRRRAQPPPPQQQQPQVEQARSRGGMRMDPMLRACQPPLRPSASVTRGGCGRATPSGRSGWPCSSRPRKRRRP
jgi:hypothetical protein